MNGAELQTVHVSNLACPGDFLAQRLLALKAVCRAPHQAAELLLHNTWPTPQHYWPRLLITCGGWIANDFAFYGVRGTGSTACDYHIAVWMHAHRHGGDGLVGGTCLRLAMLFWDSVLSSRSPKQLRSCGASGKARIHAPSRCRAEQAVPEQVHCRHLAGCFALHTDAGTCRCM